MSLSIVEKMEDVDIALAALADPSRRRVIELLIDEPRRTTELAEIIGVSVPAISRHLRVLRERGLVERVDVEGDGRGRQYQLDPARLTTLASWLGGGHWTTQLGSAADDPDTNEFLTRVGGFLDGFAESDPSFFERHLAADVELIFPGSATCWNKESTIASVAGHAPYVAWDISDSTVRPLGAALTLVVITVAVRTAANDDATPVVQSMIFDDNSDPWTLRFLQQSPAQR